MAWEKLFLVLLLSRYLCVIGQIKHVVVLMEENRSFDHVFGWTEGVNGLTGDEYNLVNTSDPASKRVYVDKVQPFVATCDPDHSTPGTTSKIFGRAAYLSNDLTNPTMGGFVEDEAVRGVPDYCAVMSMLTTKHVPVIAALAEEFALMDRFFCSHPGPTWPNRLFTLTGTAAGLTASGPWYHDEPGKLFPQKSFFDQLTEEGFTWRNYFNDTPWELYMVSVAHNTQNIANLEQFFADARDGNLPSFAWINPRSGINITNGQGSNDQHPDHDMSLGESYYKDIYEALRASPQWNETLFVITYDEHGGYYDHVPTPLNVPSPQDGEASYPDKGVVFDRLGVRIPTLLISPWIPKGLVISGPPEEQKPESNSEYSLTSIIATTRKLLGMKSPPLTNRDAWSATFEQVFNLSEPRTDCVLHLPDALPPIALPPDAEAKLPVNGLQREIMTVHAHLAGVEFPHHIVTQEHVSVWLQRHYPIHAERTARWQESKVSMNTNYSLVLRPRFLNDWVSRSWGVNQANGVNFVTISLRFANASLCLDYSGANGTVGVSNCYPSADPATNRDVAQQWTWNDDATVRPFANATLCLTNYLLQGDSRIYIRPCTSQNVAQAWAWHGPAAGNDNDGSIYFGDYMNTLGIVETKTSDNVESTAQLVMPAFFVSFVCTIICILM